VDEIRRWSEERLTTSAQLLRRHGISPCPVGPDEVGLDQAQGLMLLHLDAGFVAVAAMDFKAGKLHQRLAERLLADARKAHDGWRDGGRPTPGCQPPRPTSEHDFDLLLASGLLAVWDPIGAAPYAARAVRGDPNDAQALLVAGCVQETQSHLDSHWGRAEPARQALREAERLFQRATERDPALAEARLRFGRVLSLRGWTKQAQPILAELAQSASDARQRHLAALFLGHVYERQGRAAEAEAAYRLAVRILPAAQTSRVALAALLDRGGDPSLTRPVVWPDVQRSCSEAVGDDPWAWYLSGPSWTGLGMFREAWRRVEVP
jgi:tetratricopeptide (TPR) repeat protein